MRTEDLGTRRLEDDEDELREEEHSSARRVYPAQPGGGRGCGGGGRVGGLGVYLVVDGRGTLVGAGTTWPEVRSAMVAHVLRRMRREADAVLEVLALREVLGVASGEVVPMDDEQFESVVQAVLGRSFDLSKFDAMMSDYALEVVGP